MTFKAPLFFLCLLALPLMYHLLRRAERKALVALHQLRGECAPVAKKNGQQRIALKLGALLMAITALAQPRWNPHSVSVSGIKGRDLVIALDISRSMLAADLYPSRLEAARFVLLESLPALNGQRIGLITFAGSSAVRVPLTLDHSFVRYVLQRVSPSDADVGGTSLQAAIEKALDIVLDESERGQQDLIIFTDGEDHISNLAQVAEKLQEWGARVLIIGLGDPVEGARVPALEGGKEEWMTYKGAEVVSRLDEDTLTQLAEVSPGVIYYPAHTKPFDLLTIYRNMLAETGELELGDESQTVFDEGYRYFVALALVLVLITYKRKLHMGFALLALLYGCAPQPNLAEAEYQQRFQAGRIAWSEAQSAVESSAPLGLELLSAARENFLMAAICKPGDLPVASQIAGVSAQMRELEARLAEKQGEDEEAQQRLQQAIEVLRELTQKEEELSAQGQRLLRRRPPVPQSEKQAAAVTLRHAQCEITGGTRKVLQIVTTVQAQIQKMLGAAFGMQEKPLATELDPAVLLLRSAELAQEKIETELAPDRTNWDNASVSLMNAARGLREALEILTDQSKANTKNEDSGQDAADDGEFEEEMEWSESSDPAALSIPLRSQSFNSALNSKYMPTPNYTVEEIMAEEQANQLKRDQQNAARAGAKVEKNW